MRFCRKGLPSLPAGLYLRVSGRFDNILLSFLSEGSVDMDVLIFLIFVFVLGPAGVLFYYLYERNGRSFRSMIRHSPFGLFGFLFLLDLLTDKRNSHNEEDQDFMVSNRYEHDFYGASDDDLYGYDDKDDADYEDYADDPDDYDDFDDRI